MQIDDQLNGSNPLLKEICTQQYAQMQQDVEIGRALSRRPDNALLKARVDEHMALLEKELTNAQQKCQEHVLFAQDEAFLRDHGPWDADNKALNPLGCLPKKYISEVNHNIALQYPNLNFMLDMGGPWKGCTLTVRSPDGCDFYVELDFANPATMAERLGFLADWLKTMGMHQPVDGEPVGRQADFVWPSADLRAPGEPEYQRELRKQQDLQERNRKSHEELRRMLGL